MIFKRINEDIEGFKLRDPAARSALDVIFLYQGFHALMIYRISHFFWTARMKFVGRLVSQLGRIFTGIEIHPGAVIGRRLVIDHGMGVVIGETSNIGDDVTLYHDVTLGGVSPAINSRQQVGVKRHPTLENGVTVGSGAQILGPVVIGKNARVGSNAVVSKNVPAGLTAVGIPARIVVPKDKEKSKAFSAYGTMPEGQPDPVLITIENLREQMRGLVERVKDLEENDSTDFKDGSNKTAVEELRKLRS
jgi:serine O-acetyltransferase